MAFTPFSAPINELENLITRLAKEIASSGDEIARKKLLGVVKEQNMILESPVEVLWRMAMEPNQHACLRTAIEMRLINHVISSSGQVTADELAKLTGGDKLLIVRIMRPLVCMKVFNEVAVETYTGTPISKFLTSPSVAGGYKFMFDQMAKSCVHLPSFLSRTSYQNPEGSTGCFQSAFSTPLQMFPWLVEHPDQMANFNDFIAVKPISRVEWYDFAPLESILLDDYVEGTPLLVDIGGNRGLNLSGFKKKLDKLNVKGQLILEDLPEVINDIKELDKEIVRIKYDFFTSQPVFGARAYYLRFILHDHSNASCHTILSQIVTAMRKPYYPTVPTSPEYSRLLIFEYVLPDVGTALFPSLLDITMMSLLNGLERTETQWKHLLKNVGLEIVRFWYDGQDKNHEALIEAKLRRGGYD